MTDTASVETEAAEEAAKSEAAAALAAGESEDNDAAAAAESEAGGAEDAQTDDDKAIEVEARAMGWKPEEDFDASYRGKDRQFVDAKTFVERGRNQMPILRERLERQTQEIGELKKVVKDFRGYTDGLDKRMYAEARRQILREQSEAFKKEDEDAFEKSQKDLTDLDKEQAEAREKAPPAADAQTADPAADPAFVAWKAENPWYGKNARMTMFADNAAKAVSGLSQDDYYAALSEAVREEFPGQFGNQRRRQTTRVEGGGTRTSAQRNEHSYANLPSDSKKACDRMVGEKLLTKEEYVKNYKWDE